MIRRLSVVRTFKVARSRSDHLSDSWDFSPLGTSPPPYLVWFGGYRGFMGLIWTLSNPLFFKSARALLGGTLARGGTNPRNLDITVRGAAACLDQHLPRDTCFEGGFFFSKDLAHSPKSIVQQLPNFGFQRQSLVRLVPRQLQLRFDQWDTWCPRASALYSTTTVVLAGTVDSRPRVSSSKTALLHSISGRFKEMRPNTMGSGSSTFSIRTTLALR